MTDNQNALPSGGQIFANTDLIPASKPDKGKPGKPGKPGEDKPGEGEGNGKPGKPNGKPGDGKPGSGWPPDGNCGSGAGGDPAPTDAAARAAAEAGILPPDVLDSAIDRARKAALDHILKHDEKFKGGTGGWGKGGDLGMIRHAEKVLAAPSRIWDEYLASATDAALTRAGSADYTMARPGRRSFKGMGTRQPRGVYAPLRPSMRDRAATVAVIIDTSPSVSQKLGVTVAVTETVHLLQRDDVERVYLIPVSWVAKAAVMVYSEHDVRENLAAGGGTDMRKGIIEAEKIIPPPSVTIVFTDGGTHWNDRTDLENVIIVIIPEGWQRGPLDAMVVQTRESAPWATAVIGMDLNQSLGRMGRDKS